MNNVNLPGTLYLRTVTGEDRRVSLEKVLEVMRRQVEDGGKVIFAAGYSSRVGDKINFGPACFEVVRPSTEQEYIQEWGRVKHLFPADAKNGLGQFYYEVRLVD